MLGEPPVLAVAVGTVLDVVLDFAVSSVTNHGRSLWTGDFYQVLDTTELSGVVTLYGFRMVAHSEGVGILERTEESHAFARAPVDRSTFLRVKEVCSGIGGIGVGAAQAGCQVVACVDKSPLACRTVQANGCHAICGDVACRSVRVALHAAGQGQSCIVAAGFPCQSYSVQGRGGGLLDVRGQVLPHILQATWLMQSPALILECVAEVTRFVETISLLRKFAARSGLRMQTVTLDLQDQWCSRRHRWWCLMVPFQWPEQPLPGWPKSAEHRTVGDVIRDWPIWPRAEEQALAWTETESAMYAEPEFGTEARLLNLQGPAPTFVHSMGVALGACPCGCRSAGLSLEFLRSGGFRGFGVVSEVVQGPRFPHPCEAALLNSLPPAFLHSSDMRAALSMVGQLAAPLQALWVTQHLQCNADLAFAVPSSSTPMQAIHNFKQLLLCQQRDFWPVPSLWASDQVQLRQDGCRDVLRVSPPATVGALIQANVSLQGHGCRVEVRDNDRVLPLQAFLHGVESGAEYELVVTAKAQALVSEAPELQLVLLASDGVHVRSFPARTTLRAACRVLMLPPEISVRDACTGLELDRDRPQSGMLVVDCRRRFWAEGSLRMCTDVALSCAIQALRQKTSHTLLTPQQIEVLLLLQSRDCLELFEEALHPGGLPWHAIFRSAGHWACVVFRTLPHGAIACQLLDTPGSLAVPAAQTLHQAVGQVCRRPLAEFEVVTVFSQLSVLCGTIVVAHLLSVLGEGTDSRVVDTAVALLEQAQPHWAVSCAFGQLSPGDVSRLRTVLLSKGVPSDQVEHRIHAAVQKLGAAAISEALQAKHEWAALKVCASKPQHMFRWIKQDELAAVIKGKAKQTFGAVVPNGKAKKQKLAGKALPSHLQVEPQHLLLSPQSFTTEASEALRQLAFDEVASGARGVAFCTAQQAAPFLSPWRALSVEPLGLVTTSCLPLEACAGAPVVQLRYPAIYGPTREPVLISGSLIQLGDDPVRLAQADITDIDRIETQACKLTLYRDECSLDWGKLADAPIRLLLQSFPALVLCRNAACPADSSCPHFHAAVEEAVDCVLLDVWSRAFVKIEGGRCSPEQAAAFQAFVRVPASAIPHLHRSSGKGLYIEPRSDSGASPHAAYAVVWLPGADLGQALHHLKTCGKALAVARVGKKYGLRVKESDEMSVFQALRPTHDFVKVRVAQRYKLHPLPHGFQRHSVLQLLRQWKWLAKPLQPAKGDQEGAAWEVGAEAEPPAFALPFEIPLCCSPASRIHQFPALSLLSSVLQVAHAGTLCMMIRRLTAVQRPAMRTPGRAARTLGQFSVSSKLSNWCRLDCPARRLPPPS